MESGWLVAFGDGSEHRLTPRKYLHDHDDIIDSWVTSEVGFCFAQFERISSRSTAKSASLRYFAGFDCW